MLLPGNGARHLLTLERLSVVRVCFRAGRFLWSPCCGSVSRFPSGPALRPSASLWEHGRCAQEAGVRVRPCPRPQSAALGNPGLGSYRTEFSYGARAPRPTRLRVR